MPVTMVPALLHLLTPSWLSVSLGRAWEKSTLKAFWKKKSVSHKTKLESDQNWVSGLHYTCILYVFPEILLWHFCVELMGAESRSVFCSRKKLRQTTHLSLVSLSLRPSHTSHAWAAAPAWSICMMSFLCSLQILMNARRGGTPVPTTQCASTWKEATTAGAPTDTTAPVTVSMTTRSSTVGRSGCWTTIGALCAPARWETDRVRHGQHRNKKAEGKIHKQT